MSVWTIETRMGRKWTRLPKDIPTFGGTHKQGTVAEVIREHNDGRGRRLINIQFQGGSVIEGIDITPQPVTQSFGARP